MPFYERIFEELVEFCESANGLSEPVIFDYIQQLLENESIPMSEEFEENLETNMGIFKKLRLKIQDGEVRRKIDSIWIRWSRIQFEREREKHRRSDDSHRRNDILAISSHIAADSFIFSPSYTNTPSVSSVASVIVSPSPITPLNSLTPVDDRIKENIFIPVFTKAGEQCGLYKYSLKQSGKVVCMTEDCRVSERKKDKLHNSGVTLQTLRGHARKDHSIELNIKQKRGVTTQPIICEHCGKPFIREQTLKSHIAKIHKDTGSLLPTSPAPVPPPGPALPASYFHSQSLTDLEQAIQNSLSPHMIQYVGNIGLGFLDS